MDKYNLVVVVTYIIITQRPSFISLHNAYYYNHDFVYSYGITRVGDQIEDTP